MNIAILKDGVCVNAAVFGSLQTARQFLESGALPGADGVAELPEGYGIGDSFDGEVWTAKETPPPPEPPEEPTPDTKGFILGLMEGYGNDG